MAYPYYSYNPHQSFYAPQYQQPIQQMSQQPIQQPTPQASSPSSIIWVRNYNEAAMYPVAPNNAVALWDSSSPSIYLKQADASGKPSMKIYDLVERTETPAESANGRDEKTHSYATKDELAAVVGAVQGIDGIIATIKSEIEKMSGDLYGLAGKKKTAKKQDDEAGDE